MLVLTSEAYAEFGTEVWGRMASTGARAYNGRLVWGLCPSGVQRIPLVTGSTGEAP